MGQPFAVIIVTIQGGKVQDVEVPAGCLVTVRNYDVTGQEPDVKHDHGGDYVDTFWESED